MQCFDFAQKVTMTSKTVNKKRGTAMLNPGTKELANSKYAYENCFSKTYWYENQIN